MGRYDHLVDADNENRQRKKELHALAEFVYALPAAPAELHDLAARILDEPSLAHGAWKWTNIHKKGPEATI